MSVVGHNLPDKQEATIQIETKHARQGVREHLDHLDTIKGSRMTMHAIPHSERRSTRSSLIYVGQLLVGMTTMSVGVFLVLNTVLGWEMTSLILRDMSGSVSTIFAWALELTIVVLLAFSAAVLSGQLFTGEEDSYRLQSSLAHVGCLLAAVLFPALVLVVIHSVLHPSNGGKLMLTLPFYAFVLFLAVQLGRMNILGPTARRTVAEQSQERAETILARLQKGTPRPPALVLTVTVVSASFLGVVPVLIYHPLSYTVAAYAASLLVLDIYLAAGLLGATQQFASSQGASDRAFGIFITIFPIFTFVFTGVATILWFSWPGLIGYALAGLLIGISAWSQRLSNWSTCTLRRAGREMAIRSLNKQLSRARDELARLPEPEKEERSAATMRESLRAIFRK